MSIRKMTFSLTSLIFLIALGLAAMPAMANTLSGTWTTDLNADGTADDSGWNLTVVFTTAPTASGDGALPTVDVSDGTAGAFDPAAGDGTVKTFKLPIPAPGSGSTQDVTLDGYRRVTLTVGVNVASTNINLPKLKRIDAPDAVNQVFMATIEFEAVADEMAGPPKVAAIGPPDGFIMSDITVTNGAVLSLTKSGMTYTATINPTTAGTNVVVSIDGTAFEHQTATVTANATATVIFDTTAPTLVTANTATDGANTMIVNNRRAPKPDQWGPGNFDFLFSVTDENGGSGIDISQITIEDDQNPAPLILYRYWHTH